jgi:SAM-dependent methyltransferase
MTEAASATPSRSPNVPHSVGQVTKLNIGCGTDIRTGYINIDSKPLPGVDLTHDIENSPLPFATATVDEILCLNVLEHVDLIPVMKELHRVLKTGGRLIAEVPHFSSGAMYMDPTHRNFFSTATLQFFTRSSPRPYYFDFAFEGIETQFLHFPKRRLLPLNGLVERLVNRSARFCEYYEGSGLRSLIPASYLTTVLRR